MYAGIDIGTQSVKAIIIDSAGDKIAFSKCDLKENNYYISAKGYQCHEQGPKDWWKATRTALKKVLRPLKRQNKSATDIEGISICGTSGTMVFLDDNNQPLMPALMYDDNRAVNEATEINRIAESHCNKLGYKFSASFGLPKIYWIQKHRPEIWAKTAKVIHCADFIAGKLTGEFNTSEYSNALKTGYDILEDKWPDFIPDQLNIDLKLLPHIVSPGEFIGNSLITVDDSIHLPSKIEILGGLTDSTASVLSSGAVGCGDLFSVLGSTIVEKVVSESIVKDKEGRIYSHKLPFGNYLVGGASNVGSLALVERFGKLNTVIHNETVKEDLPTKHYTYPLLRKGERFPIVNSKMSGFEIGEFQTEREKFGAYIEGLSFAERMMIDVFNDVGVSFGSDLYSVGGGTLISSWMQLRATILNKSVLVPKFPEAAFGCALLVGSVKGYNRDLQNACDEMVDYSAVYEPEINLLDDYTLKFDRFRAIIDKKLETEWKI